MRETQNSKKSVVNFFGKLYRIFCLISRNGCANVTEKSVKFTEKSWLLLKSVNDFFSHNIKNLKAKITKNSKPEILFEK